MKLCIFDLDGTLLNTLTNISYFVNEALTQYGLEKIDEKILMGFIGNGARKLISRSLDYLGSGEDVSAVLETYMKKYDANASYLVKPYDGIVGMLETLKENGVKIAVLSNKPHSSTTLILDKIFGENYFYIVRGHREGEAVKPDPAVANELAQGFDKSQCSFIGDSDVDIKTGKNAGMKTIGVSWGYRGKDVLRAAGADCIADTPDDIIKAVLQ